MRAKAVSKRKKLLENLTFSALLCEQMQNEQERQTTKQKNIAGQVLTYNSKNFH